MHTRNSGTHTGREDGERDGHEEQTLRFNGEIIMKSIDRPHNAISIRYLESLLLSELVYWAASQYR